MKELAKGTKIRFKSMNDFTGSMMQLEGAILGDAKAVKKTWPEEMGELSGDEECYLVKRWDDFGNDFHHCVFANEIVEVIRMEKELS